MASMAELIRAGVWGAVAGFAAGAPLKGKSGFTRIAFYDPIPVRMAPSEGLDAWWIWLGHLRAKRGRAALGPTLHAQWASVQPESAFGLANLAMGLGPSLSGALRNPLAQGSGAFTRALFWGLAFHGQPDEAARWAFADASLDHAGDGAALPACAAWMAAAAQPGVSPSELGKVFTRILPPGSLFLKALPRVLEAGGHDEGPRELRQTLPGVLGLADDTHAALTMAFAFAGLLRHKGSFSGSLLAAAGCGGAADQAGCIAGCIGALLSGGVPAEYLAPLGREYVGSHALRGLESPAEISELAAWVEQIAGVLAPVLPAPAPALAAAPAAPAVPAEAASADTAAAQGETEGQAPAEPSAPQDSGAAPAESAPETPATEALPEPAAQAEAVPESPALPSVPEPDPSLAALLASPPLSTCSEANGMEVVWRHLESPILGPRQSAKMTLTFVNLGEEDKEVFPELGAPDGFKSASRLSPFRLPAKASQTFPVVMQAPDAPLPERVFARLRAGTAEYKTPLLPAQRWHLVGPFVNHDGSGYDRAITAESTLTLSYTFNGRSDLPVKWEQRWMEGVAYNLEPEFRNGPGVVLMWAKVSLPVAGKITVVCACSVGVVVKIDGQKVLAYHDEHQPVLNRLDRYAASFQSSGEFSILVRVLRNKKPLEPLLLWFMGPDGQVVHPVQFHPMA